jgi:hypothetical protein
MIHGRQKANKAWVVGRGSQLGQGRFQWVWKEVVGHSGGILMGFKTDLFEMEY